MITSFNKYNKCELFINKLEIFFNTIKLKEHSVKVYHDPESIQIYNGDFGKFTVEDFMFYENDGEKDYPYLPEYISSKIHGSTSDYVDCSKVPRDVIFSKEEYNRFIKIKKYNI